MSGRAARVVVVGAGPAGAACALLLARAGHDVLLLDRAAFPRPKPCGECLSPGAGPVLARLGVLAGVEGARPARLTAWRIVGPEGSELRAGFGQGAEPTAREGLALPRERLDALLVAAAVAAGARLLERHQATGPLRDARGRTCGVRARGPEGEELTLRADLVVAADGLRSRLARRMGLAGPPGPLRKLSLTAHLRGVDGDPAMGELHVGRGLCAGLAAVAGPAAAGPGQSAGGPAGSGRPPEPLPWNVTVVADAGRHGAAVRRDPAAFFRAALEELPGVRGRVPELDGGARLLASGPFQRPVRRLAIDGAALVGDAAGYFDPFTGQGIYHALSGAERLAEVADRALARGVPSARALRPYAAAHGRALAEAHLLQRGVEAVLSRPCWCEAALLRLRTSPAFAERLLAATGDLARARSLLSPLPLLAFLTSRPGAP